MVFVISRLEIPLLKLHDMCHPRALVDLLKELLHNVIAALSLALNLGKISSVSYDCGWAEDLLCHM